MFGLSLSLGFRGIFCFLGCFGGFEWEIGEGGKLEVILGCCLPTVVLGL